MKKLLPILLLLIAAPVGAKTIQMSCNAPLRNLGVCNGSDSGVLLAYWIPLTRWPTVRDSQLGGYSADLLCTNKPAEPVRPWDASVAYIEDGHCSQSESQQFVANPIPANRWIDFQFRLSMRRALRNQRIRVAQRIVGDTERALPIEQFEENPD